MKRGKLYRIMAIPVGILCCLATAAPQTSTPSPLGVLVSPPARVAVPAEIRSLLPEGAVVRLLGETKLAPQGESIVVYDFYHQSEEPDSHIWIVRSGQVVTRYDLRDLFQFGEEFTVVALASFSLDRDGTAAAAVAFRNMGNGATSYFLVLRANQQSYEVMFSRVTTQGRLNILQGENPRLELWSALEDGETPLESCTWCPHQYEVETFEWRQNNFAKVERRQTQQRLDPYRVADQPLVVTSGIAPQ